MLLCNSIFHFLRNMPWSSQVRRKGFLPITWPRVNSRYAECYKTKEFSFKCLAFIALAFKVLPFDTLHEINTPRPHSNVQLLSNILLLSSSRLFGSLVLKLLRLHNNPRPEVLRCDSGKIFTASSQNQKFFSE